MIGAAILMGMALVPAAQTEACPAHLAGQGHECFAVEVPLDHSSPDRADRLLLRGVVLRASGASPAPRAFVFIAGGPGQGSTEQIEFVQERFGSLRDTHDIVLVDQRGTGRSGRLDCELHVDAADVLSDMFPRASVRACAARLAKETSLAQYTVLEAVDDLETVRRALDYETLDLFGTSYGTHVARLYTQRHAARVSTLTLKGVADLRLTVETFGRASEQGLQRLATQCREDASCRSAYPDFPKSLTRVLERLDDAPITVTASSGGLRGTRFQVTAGPVAAGIRSFMQSSELSRELPWMISRADAGDLEPLALRIAALRLGAKGRFAYGLHFSALCAEHEPGRTDAGGGFAGDYWYRQLDGVCALWPHRKLPPGALRPRRIDTPALLLSGWLDPATPPENAERLLPWLTNAVHLVAPLGSHSNDGFEECTGALVATLVRTGDPRRLDDRCLQAARLPPFRVEPHR